MNKKLAVALPCLITLLLFTVPVLAQDASNWLSSLPQAKDYVQHRVFEL